MKKLRLFDSLKFVRFVVAVVAATFILNVANADTSINSVIAYGKTEQNGTPTPTAPVPIMTNNGVLKASKNLFDDSLFDTATGTTIVYRSFSIPNGIYTMSTNFTAVQHDGPKSNVFIFAGRVSSGANSSINGVYSTQPRTITVTDGYYTVAYRSALSSTTVNDNPKNFDWMLEKGPTATAYEPYGIYADGMVETIRDSAGHTATAQMLLGLNDTYRDEQNINTGAITRKVGVKVFDGTENWSNGGAQNGYTRFVSGNIDDKKFGFFVLSNMFKSKTNSAVWNDETEALISGNNNTSNLYLSFPVSLLNCESNAECTIAFKAWLAEQYANGTPVIVVYPLATETTENVTTQSLTTAPVRQTAGSILGMPIEVVFGDGTREWVREMITIATTKYSEAQFAPVETRLDAAVAAVDTVVSQTMSQAQQIDQIANNKQTRPDESCPPFKKCLLVEDEDGTPHWYEIYDPINDFLNPILAAAGLSGNQGAPVMTTHTENGSTIYDTFNGFYNGSIVFQRKYINSTAGAGDRPFGPTTLARCADNATRTTSPVSAGLCYNTGGMFRTLTEGADDDSGEWALVWNGAEGGASLGITPGVVYGVAKCTSVGQHTTQMTGDVVDGSNYWWPKKLTGYNGGGTTLASLIEQYPNSNIETVFNTLPNPVGTDDNPEYPRANYRNCWCKMTAIGVPGAGETDEQRYANGTIMSVSGGWAFGGAYTSARECAYDCASNCAYYVRTGAAFRKNVLTVK